ncbi:MAG: T9SS type A sorting domain-containing protein [Chitinophagaceae bacterium]|nr:T9SS type A sorting domain-containing protein [Chitinophagaceae bacterium]
MPVFLQAQQIENKGTTHFTPGGYLDTVQDLYGKKYSLSEITIGRSLKAIANGNGTPAAVAASCSSGYFQLYLEPGCGMDGSDATSVARLNVLCRVLTDLSAFINSPCAATGQKVNILVGSGLSGSAAGIASPFFNMPYSTVVSGIVDNTIWITLNSGKDAFTNVAAPISSWSSGSSGPTFYHGSIKFNFTGSLAWHTDLTTPPAPGKIDLYTIALHEMMHAMGFATLIDYNGNPVFGTNYKYYSRYDLRLETALSQPLLVSTGPSGCNMYNWTFNPVLTPVSATLSPGGISVCPAGYQTGSIVDHTICSNGVKYSGSWPLGIPVYTPECFERGSSLSHFEDECHVPPGFVLGAAGTATNNQYYVMSNSAPPGTYSAAANPGVMKRYPRPEERQVFCDIGYSVNTVYGSASFLNYYSYGGSPCAGLQLAGMNDGISPGGIYTYTTTGTTPVNINPSTAAFLANDHGVAGGTFKCLEVVAGGGSLSVNTGSISTPVMFTPAAGAGGVQLLRYIPVSSSGSEGNITYIYVYVADGSCSSSACDLVLNGNFESIASPGGGGMWRSHCWSAYAESPDLYERGCSTPWWCFPAYSMAINPAVHPVDTTGNDHYIGIVAGASVAPAYGTEAVNGQLSSGLVNGISYRVSFWAKLADIPPTATVPPGVPFGFPTSPPVHVHVAVSTTFPLIGSSGALTSLPSGLNLLSDFVVSHPDVFWHYYTTDVTYAGPTGARSLVIMQAPWIDSSTAWQQYLLLDDISIVPASIACSIDLPDTINYSQILHLDSFVNVPGGTFRWYADSAGYTIVAHGNMLNATSASIASLAAGNDGIVSVCYKYTTVLGCVSEVCDEVYIRHTTSVAGPMSTSSCFFSAVPNPSTSDVTIIGNIDDSYNDNTVTITLTDILGRIILQETAMVTNGRVNKKLSVSNVANGQYFIKIKNGNINTTVRLIIQK